MGQGNHLILISWSWIPEVGAGVDIYANVSPWSLLMKCDNIQPVSGVLCRLALSYRKQEVTLSVHFTNLAEDIVVIGVPTQFI